MTTRTAIYIALSQIMSMLPASTAELAEAVGMRKRTVCNWMRELQAAGMVARGELRQREGRVYLPADARPYERAGWRYPAHGLQRFITAWHALRARQTTDTMAALLNVTRRTASELLLAMHEHRVITVAGWQMRHQTWMPMYDRLPRGGDVPRPPRTPRSELNATYWARRTAGLVGQPEQVAA